MFSTLSTLVFAASSAAFPAYFEANIGQAPPEILARGVSGGTTFDVTRQGLRMINNGASARLLFDRPQKNLEHRFEAKLSARVRDSRLGKNIPVYERVVLENVWPGIDVLVLSRDGKFAFDLLLEPGVDPARAGFILEGEATIDRASGALIVRDARGALALTQPIALQGRERRSAGFVLEGSRAGFRVDGRDPSLPLVIDPVVEYATFAPSNVGLDLIARDGFLYLALGFSSGAAPGRNAIYLAKIDPSETGAASLIWANSIAPNNPAVTPTPAFGVVSLDMDAGGKFLICGGNGSGDPYVDTDDVTAMPPRTGNATAVVLINDAMTIQHVTSFGSSSPGDCRFDTITPTFYMTGREDSGPPAPNEIPDMTGWGYLVQVDPLDDPMISGDDFVFATRLGTGSTLGHRMTVDPTGVVTLMLNSSNSGGPDVDAWVTMSSFQSRKDEGAICKFSPSLGANALLACTYFGGSGEEQVGTMTTDPAGKVYTVVENRSMDYPTQPNGPTPANGLVVSRFTSDLSQLDYSYFFPDSLFARPSDVEIMDDLSVAIGDGYSAATDWHHTSCSIGDDHGGNIGVLDNQGSLVFGSKTRGMAAEVIAPLRFGRVAIAGEVSAPALLAPYVNGFETMSGGVGLMVMNTGNECMDLTITGQASGAVTKVGDVISFDLEAINQGPDDASDVFVRLSVPDKMRIVEVTTTIGACTSTVPGRPACEIGPFTAGSTVTVQLLTVTTTVGVSTVEATVRTSDIDLDPSNSIQTFGVSIGPPTGPCGAVSVYGLCMGNSVHICRNRNTMNELLEVIDCAAINAECVAARGRNQAFCDPIAFDGGVADADPAPDAIVPPPPDAGTPDTGSPRLDATTTPEPMMESGCDCATTSGSESITLFALLFVALVVVRRRT